MDCVKCNSCFMNRIDQTFENQPLGTFVVETYDCPECGCKMKVEIRKTIII